jgi:hypothetical protein
MPAGSRLGTAALRYYINLKEKDAISVADFNCLDFILLSKIPVQDIARTCACLVGEVSSHHLWEQGAAGAKRPERRRG